MTRSRRRSPERTFTFGAVLRTPHSTARLGMRRSTRSELFAVLTCIPSRKRFAANSDANSLVISSRRARARGLYFVRAPMPVRYHVQFFRQALSNVARAHGSTRLSQNALRVGMDFGSRKPASPFASETRCADSICRATLSLPCLVDSRTGLPCHTNLYQ